MGGTAAVVILAHMGHLWSNSTLAVASPGWKVNATWSWSRIMQTAATDCGGNTQQREGSCPVGSASVISD